MPRTKSKVREANKKAYLKHKDKRLDYMSKWYLKNKDKVRASALQRQYGITEEIYKALFKSQKGKCAICKKKEKTVNSAGEIKRLAIDHDHKTGKVRALLCKRCNNGLGHFLDSPVLLNEAAEYLVFHGKG